MSEDTTIDWFLLESYVAGVATPAERAQVEQWMAAHAAHQHTVARVRAALYARRRVRRDWRRAEAIDTVMARVRAGNAQLTAATALRPRQLETSPTPERLMQRIRQWFEGATELAAAMLLDVNESALTTDEVTALRNRIDNAKRDNP